MLTRAPKACWIPFAVNRRDPALPTTADESAAHLHVTFSKPQVLAHTQALDSGKDSIGINNNAYLRRSTHPFAKMTAAWKAAGLTYNRYLAVASRAIRRSLKEDKRINAERRAVSELRFATWKNGKAGEPKDLAAANAAAMAESASS